MTLICIFILFFADDRLPCQPDAVLRLGFVGVWGGLRVGDEGGQGMCVGYTHLAACNQGAQGLQARGARVSEAARRCLAALTNNIYVKFAVVQIQARHVLGRFQ